MLDDLRPGDHVCCLYESAAQRAESLRCCIDAGLAGHQRIVLVTDVLPTETCLERLCGPDHDWKEHLDSRQLVVATSNGTYVRDGRFNPDQLLSAMEMHCERSTEEGYRGLRWIADMDFLATVPGGPERIFEMETRLNGFLADKPCMAMDLYGLERFDSDMLLELLTVHPIVAIGGRPRENFYYLPSRGPLTPTQSDEVLRHLLETLQTRMEVEQALRESEGRFRGLVQAAGMAIVCLSPTGRVVEFNREAGRALGLDRGEAMGRDVQEWTLPGDDRTHMTEAIAAANEGRTPAPLEVQMCGPGGRTAEMLWHLTRLTDARGRGAGVVMVGEDITRRHRTEQHLAEAQKFEMIGQLAGGISHHFNNLLTVIMGNAELLQRTLPADSNKMTLAQQIIDSAQRGADLTGQLLAFARRGKYQVIAVDIHEMIRRVVQLLSVTIDKRIEIKLNFQAVPSMVMGDPTQLETVFLNMALNARDAMPSGGRIIFATDVVDVDEGFCELHSNDIDPGRYIRASVIDTGVGMTPETQARLFEPFFTTKEVGQGAGLGLASAYGSVKNHGGTVAVQTQLNGGTTFHVFLPLSDQEAPAPQAEEEPAEPETRRGGHILLVDDEEPIRQFVGKVLREQGYEVSTCGDGAEAVEFYRRYGREIDLVILDMVMPRMDGPDTLRQLRRIDPDVRAMLSSGFSIQDLPGEILEQGVSGFLAKPYRIEEMTRKIAEALSGR